MRIAPRFALAGPLACALVLGGGTALAGDVFDFIPPGGRTLLLRVLEGRPSADEAKALLTSKRTCAEWQAYLRERGKTVAPLKKLTDKELATLADYLARATPLPAAKVPAAPAAANVQKALPPDGRDFALDYCQSCHIITVVVTQDRSREAWQGTLNKPSHVEVKLDREQREALVDYLLLNAAIPVDLVPEDLRAGGATY